MLGNTTWLELWEPLEQLPDDSEDIYPEDIYTSLFLELEKALSHRLKTAANEDEKAHRIYFEISTDPAKARTYIKELDGDKLAGDAELVVFFKNAYDVFSENSDELCIEFVRLLGEFLNCHNIRYTLQQPFKLKPHLLGVFASIFAEIVEVTERDDHLLKLMRGFEHSFDAVSRSHSEIDMATCIAKASILVEGLGNAHSFSKGSMTLGKIYGGKVSWFPHKSLQGAMGQIYGFCSDYPGIRHAGTSESVLRELELKDSIIVPLLLLTAAGYFLTYQNIAEIIGINVENT